jgi:hypothetical protein
VLDDRFGTTPAADVVDDDGGAFGRELLGDSGADSVRGTRDDGDFAFESVHDGSFDSTGVGGTVS